VSDNNATSLRQPDNNTLAISAVHCDRFRWPPFSLVGVGEIARVRVCPEMSPSWTTTSIVAVSRMDRPARSIIDVHRRAMIGASLAIERE
jgi:hypothetical protein